MKKSAFFSFLNSISFQEKLFFSKHLSIMVKSGIPIAEAVETLAAESRSKNLKRILNDVASQINNGKSLADALSKYPFAFDELYINLIEVGEQSGTLEESLVFLADHLSKQYALKKKVQGALLYPLVVISATFIMGAFISVYVLPQLVDFFDAFDFPLPLSTRVLLAFASLMKDFGVLIILGIIAAVLGLIWFVRLPKIKPSWHKLILKLPLIGSLIAFDQLANFSRNLGTMIKSGLPLTRAIEVTAKTLTNYVFSHDVTEVSRLLQEGDHISETLEKHKFKEFPALVTKMIGVGEKTGNLDSTLLYLSEFYEEEIDNISKNLSNILEPIILIVIGIIVGMLALAIIGPIYQLTGSIR